MELFSLEESLLAFQITSPFNKKIGCFENQFLITFYKITKLIVKWGSYLESQWHSTILESFDFFLFKLRFHWDRSLGNSDEGVAYSATPKVDTICRLNFKGHSRIKAIPPEQQEQHHSSPRCRGWSDRTRGSRSRARCKSGRRRWRTWWDCFLKVFCEYLMVLTAKTCVRSI